MSRRIDSAAVLIRLCALLAAAAAAAACDGVSSGGDGVRCAPGGGGPYWLAEGETVAAQVSCSTGLDLGDDGFVLDPLPDGADWDGATRTLTWTPRLDQAAVYRIAIAAPEVQEQGELVIGVADAWDAPGNVPVVDPLAYPMEYGLPVLFLSPAPTQEDPPVPVTVYYGGRRYDAEGKLRGKTSLEYPKNSYTLRFAHPRFSDPDADGGFLDKERVVLTSTFDDNSYVRQRLAYELWSRLEPSVPVQAYNVVVYIDGEYFGLYLAGDHIDDELMQASGLSGTGNLYKAIDHDANFRLTDSDGAPKNTLHQGYEKKEGLPPPGQAGSFDDLDDLVDFVATSSAGAFAAGIADKVDLADYEKWWMLVTCIQADDSAGKNSYHYHDAQTAWRVVPWDFNGSFGQDWETLREDAADVGLYQWANHLFERLLADGALGAAMRADFRAAFAPGGPLDPDAVRALVDKYAEEIDPSARRDWARWQAAYRDYFGDSGRDDFTSYEEEVDYLRTWVSARAAALDDAI